jgi:hypothetical protein
MPIRFRCENCRQSLIAIDQKAGSTVRCPKCRTQQTVPETETSHRLDSDEPPPGPASSDLILFPRRRFYYQGATYLVLGAAALAAGYFIGRGDAHYQQKVKQEDQARDLVKFEGKLEYRPEPGHKEKARDSGAVILVVPADKVPAEPLSAEEIGPDHPPPPSTHPIYRSIDEAGGLYARAGESGDFSSAIPRGEYCLLLISAHAKRADGDTPDKTTLAEMGKYFDRPEKLIGRWRYRWGRQKIDSGSNPIELDFSVLK